VVFTSAIKGKGVEKIILTITDIDRERKKHLKTSDLNDFLNDAVTKRQPPAKAGKLIKFNYVTQAEGTPPTFVFFCTHPKFLDPSYHRFLENQLRERFGFMGTPINLVFKARRKS
jgi:GTPase